MILSTRWNSPDRIPLLRRVGALRLALVCAAFACSLQTGCVHRRLTIQSDPPGALAIIDGEEIGFTPVSTDRTYYGTSEIQLIKPGYETLTTMQRVRPPWYQIFPIEFFADNFWPWGATDRQGFRYALEPKRNVPTPELLDRANQTRSEARFGQ